MRESLNEPISVVFYYDAEKRHLKPHVINWHGRDYKLGKIDFHHTTKSGLDLIHHFSVAAADGSAYFKISLHSRNLNWHLEEYMDASEAEVHYASV